MTDIFNENVTKALALDDSPNYVLGNARINQQELKVFHGSGCLSFPVRDVNIEPFQNFISQCQPARFGFGDTTKLSLMYS
jgi:hypothetical protein